MELCYSCTNPSTLSRELSRYIPLFVEKYENNYNRSMQIQHHLMLCCLTGEWCEIYGNNHREAPDSSKLGPMNLILLEQSLNVDWPVSNCERHDVSCSFKERNARYRYRSQVHIYFVQPKWAINQLYSYSIKVASQRHWILFCLYDLPTKSLNPNHL